MNRKKLMSLVIAGVLLIGAVSYGTNALFRKTVDTTTPNIVLTTGTLDLSVSEGEWKLVGDKTVLPSNSYEFTNVKPGDSFEKTIRVNNTGSLNQKLTIKNGDWSNKTIDVTLKDGTIKNVKIDDLFEIEHNLDALDETILYESESSDLYKLTVKMREMPTGTIEGEDYNMFQAVEFNLNDIGILQITATQTNEI